ncbi:MAG: hypothetical protein ACPGUD_04735 [Parashewanella sp.]
MVKQRLLSLYLTLPVLLVALQVNAQDLGEMWLINDTAREVNLTIAETIWVSAHNKKQINGNKKERSIGLEPDFLLISTQ